MALNLLIEFVVLAPLVEQAAKPENPFAQSPHANTSSCFLEQLKYG
ncbi:MAG TPA: hypothetical protein VFA77_01690 [Candidatus Eisenbacteria bacterium]|nr:hypothetical protein [Candidatus Eisenbacteria bacterium]